MTAFFIGLQFLTRISIVRQTEWSEDNFGKSVKYFTLVGAVLGICLAALAAFFYIFLPFCGIAVPRHFSALFLVAAGIALTGGLKCDGLMDTMDGIFSGRSRARMLEIMKDSRVGSNGVVGFVLLVFAKWSCLIDQTPVQVIAAVFLAPILGHLAMVMAITLFPYARPEGIGKAFAAYANKKSLAFAASAAFFCVLLAGWTSGLWAQSAAAFVASALCGWLLCRYMAKILGGLTGDTYGAVAELTEAVVLMMFIF